MSDSTPATAATDYHPFLNGEFSEWVTFQVNHLVTIVKQHSQDRDDGDEGDFTVAWEADRGWWLSIVCPGHYAFEEEGHEHLPGLVQRAVDYYASEVPLWPGGGGCQEHHPIPEAANV